MTSQPKKDSEEQKYLINSFGARVLVLIRIHNISNTPLISTFSSFLLLENYFQSPFTVCFCWFCIVSCKKVWEMPVLPCDGSDVVCYVHVSVKQFHL